jgi:hypothetical protein
LRLQRRGEPDFGDETRNGKQPVLDGQSGRDANLGERTVDQALHAHQAPVQYAGRRAVYPDVAGLDRRNRQRRRMDEITQLVRKDAQALVPCTGVAVGNDRIALIAKLGDGVGDRVVETAIERPKLLDRDRGIDLDCQIRYRLAKIAVVVNDLLDGKNPCCNSSRPCRPAVSPISDKTGRSAPTVRKPCGLASAPVKNQVSILAVLMRFLALTQSPSPNRPRSRCSASASRASDSRGSAG